MTPPDSDEREVQLQPMEEWLEKDCPSLDSLCPDCVADLLAIEKGLKAQIEHWRYLAVRGVGSDAAIIPLSLAQRILGALEDIDTQEVRAIRAELRARVPR